ncbi:helix-turn-helix transcriptional regulator [Streptomyces sp. NPDC051079]|uniref:helix-turn-helix domain-containing protein n=1 Tax=unclassified Streptomyces TaxID=2593676 RepID=UPI0034508476
MPKDAAVEEFARRVRALKTRDGRSYEALGRRLNVSASTLHRYCSGATVPEEFGVLDRLAVLAGADEEERRALEEAWTTALSTRRPAEPEPEAAPAEPEAASPEPEPGPEAASAPARDVTPSAPGRPRNRSRRPVLAAATLAAVAALTLGAVLLPRGNPEQTAPTTPPAAPPSPPASPPPLTVTSASHIWENGCGHTYLVARGPDRVPAPPVAADARRWAAAQGAVHGGQTLVRLSVQGKGAKAVVLQGLHVRVVERGTPLPWSGYRMDEGCGGAVTPRLLAVELDRPRPVARPVAGYDASGAEGRTIPALSFPYAVTAADPEELLVSARTAGCDCRWYLELEWSAEGRTGTVRVGDEYGRPFRTSGTKGRPVYGYDSAGRAWITDPESGQAG